MATPPREIEERYRKLLADARYCTIATASADGDPEAAIVAFARAPEQALYLYTFNDSRKYQNLQQNPRAAMTLFKHPEYAQLDGEMEELRAESAQQARRTLEERSSGDLEEFHEDSRCRYFRFHPTRISLRIDDSFPSKYEVWNPQENRPPQVKEL